MEAPTHPWRCVGEVSLQYQGSLSGAQSHKALTRVDGTTGAINYFAVRAQDGDIRFHFHKVKAHPSPSCSMMSRHTEQRLSVRVSKELTILLRECYCNVTARRCIVEGVGYGAYRTRVLRSVKEGAEKAKRIGRR